jgi:hypothetical protein
LLSKTYAIGFATLSDGGEKSPTFPAAIGDVQRLPRRPNQFLIQSLLIHVYGFHVPVSAQFLVQINHAHYPQSLEMDEQIALTRQNHCDFGDVLVMAIVEVLYDLYFVSIGQESFMLFLGLQLIRSEHVRSPP